MATSSNKYKSEISIQTPYPRDVANPKRVEVNIRMDWIYKRMITQIQLDPQAEDLFERGCLLFILSGAMFEAWTNWSLRRLHTLYEGGHDELLLGIIEKNRIDDKLQYIHGRSQKLYNILDRPLLRIVIDMRNRLMHFKDKPTEWTEQFVEGTSAVVTGTTNVAEALYNMAPNPKIYNDIVNQDLASLKIQILDLHGKLSEFEKELKLNGS